MGGWCAGPVSIVSSCGEIELTVDFVSSCWAEAAVFPVPLRTGFWFGFALLALLMFPCLDSDLLCRGLTSVCVTGFCVMTCSGNVACYSADVENAGVFVSVGHLVTADVTCRVSGVEVPTHSSGRTRADDPLTTSRDVSSKSCASSVDVVVCGA